MKLAHLTFAAALSVTGTSALAADIVVVGHPTAAAMTKEQVSDLFLGKSQSSTPVDQTEGSPVYTDFYKKATGKDPAQVKATWSRLVFTGKAQAPKQAGDSAAVKKAVAADPKAVGYIEKTAVDGTVKVLVSVD